jgi:hypothetical protein
VKWEFGEEWQPLGYAGSVNRNGILSFSPISFSQGCAERALGIKIDPLGQEYNDNEGNQRGVIITEAERKRNAGGKPEAEQWWDSLEGDGGFPLWQYAVVIAGILVLALLAGVACRLCSKKNRNRVDKDGDFSMSEEERRATVVKAAILSDMIERES